MVGRQTRVAISLPTAACLIFFFVFLLLCFFGERSFAYLFVHFVRWCGRIKVNFGWWACPDPLPVCYCFHWTGCRRPNGIYYYFYTLNIVSTAKEIDGCNSVLHFLLAFRDFLANGVFNLLAANVTSIWRMCPQPFRKPTQVFAQLSVSPVTCALVSVSIFVNFPRTQRKQFLRKINTV